MTAGVRRQAGFFRPDSPSIICCVALVPRRCDVPDCTTSTLRSRPPVQMIRNWREVQGTLTILSPVCYCEGRALLGMSGALHLMPAGEPGKNLTLRSLNDRNLMVDLDSGRVQQRKINHQSHLTKLSLRGKTNSGYNVMRRSPLRKIPPYC